MSLIGSASTILRLSMVIALGGERFGNIGGGHRAEELIVFAGFAREFERNAGEQFGKRLRRFLFGGFLLGER